MTMKKRHICCFGCAVLTALSSIAIAICAALIVGAIVKTQLPMKDRESMLFKVWQDSAYKKLPVARQMYMWNLTNPMEVYNREELPNFVKVGPYVYLEHLVAPMDSIQWSDDQSLLSFEYVSEFTWSPELSVDPVHGQLNENDTFTTLNLALWSAGYRVNRFPYEDGFGPIMQGVSCDTMASINNGTVLGKNGYFIQPKVHEFLFGYRDDIWAALQEATVIVPTYHVPSIFRTMFNNSQPAPSPYTYATGLTCPIWDNQSLCNSSGSSRNVIHTGVGDLSSLGQYVEWAGQDSFWWWANDGNDHDGGDPQDLNQTCQTVHGSNAMNYPPGLTSSDHPYVFVDNIFRSVKLQYTQDVTVKDVPTLQFGISEDEKVLGTPNSKCYHMRYPAVFNLTNPYFAPMLVSQPYFWGVPNATSILVDEPDLPAGQRGTSILNFTVNGTHVIDLIDNMDPSEAELILRVEPLTGVLMHANGRVQMGTWLKPFTECPGKFEDLGPKTDANGTVSYFPYTMMPIMYLDRTVTAPDDLAKYLYNVVVLSVLLCRIFGGVVAAGAIGGAVALHCHLRRNKENLEHKDLYDPIAAVNKSETSHLIPTDNRRM